jgi:hypothetical protein
VRPGGEYAIQDYPNYGRAFGNGTELRVCNESRSSNQSSSNAWKAYINDTGIQGEAVFTGARNFTVDEIEVFEII